MPLKLKSMSLRHMNDGGQLSTSVHHVRRSVRTTSSSFCIMSSKRPSKRDYTCEVICDCAIVCTCVALLKDQNRQNLDTKVDRDRSTGIITQIRILHALKNEPKKKARTHFYILKNDLKRLSSRFISVVLSIFYASQQYITNFTIHSKFWINDF